MGREKSGAIDNWTELLQVKYSIFFYVGCFTEPIQASSPSPLPLDVYSDAAYADPCAQ